METPNRRPWWRYLRLDLRGLMVLILIVGAWLGGLARSARIQRDAVAAIQRAGGSVAYDWQLNTKGDFIPGSMPWVPRWLVDNLGVDYFGHVVFVNLGKRGSGGNPGSDAELAHIGNLSRLETLNLDVTRVTDAGMAHLKGLTRLKGLTLGATEIGDAGLVHLEGLTSLQLLNLNSTRVSDAGLTHLQKLTDLQGLHLHRTAVTDGGLTHLVGLKRLQVLQLGGTQVTDAGVNGLQKALPRLKIRPLND
jgi:internalin A